MANPVVSDFEIVYHGVDSSDYFQGCGVSGTKFAECSTGVGYSEYEAFEDALEMIAQNGIEPSADLEAELAECDKKTLESNSEFGDLKHWVSIRYNTVGKATSSEGTKFIVWKKKYEEAGGPESGPDLTVGGKEIKELQSLEEAEKFIKSQKDPEEYWVDVVTADDEFIITYHMENGKLIEAAVDEWLDQNEVNAYCPQCADSMVRLGLKKIRASVLVEALTELKALSAWKDLPKGWTKKSLKSFWDSLTGDHKHKITQCIKKFEGTRISDPGAFCASLARKAGYASAEETLELEDGQIIVTFDPESGELLGVEDWNGNEVRRHGIDQIAKDVIEKHMEKKSHANTNPPGWTCKTMKDGLEYCARQTGPFVLDVSERSGGTWDWIAICYHTGEEPGSGTASSKADALKAAEEFVAANPDACKISEASKNKETWQIYDWAGNLMKWSKKYKNFEDASDALSEKLHDMHPNISDDEFEGLLEDYWIKPQGGFEPWSKKSKASAELPSFEEMKTHLKGGETKRFGDWLCFVTEEGPNEWYWQTVPVKHNNTERYDGMAGTYEGAVGELHEFIQNQVSKEAVSSQCHKFEIQDADGKVIGVVRSADSESAIKAYYMSGNRQKVIPGIKAVKVQADNSKYGPFTWKEIQQKVGDYEGLGQAYAQFVARFFHMQDEDWDIDESIEAALGDIRRSSYGPLDESKARKLLADKFQVKFNPIACNANTKTKWGFSPMGGEGKWQYFSVTRYGEHVGNLSVNPNKKMVGIVPQDTDPGLYIDQHELSELYQALGEYVGVSGLSARRN